MGFLNALRSWSGQAGSRDQEPGGLIDRASDPKLRSADAASPAIDSKIVEGSATLYDREQWRKKLKRILEKLPDSQAEWNHLEQESRALNFGDDWVARTYLEELGLMIRKIVSDRVVTPEEHHKIDLARSLMGITDVEAESILNTIAAEATTFFGDSVSGA